MEGEDGVDELVSKALADGVDPNEVLNQGLMVGMSRVGEQFSRNEVFVPELLMAARAMSAGMAHLKPHFDSGAAKRKGTFVVGTVTGDLHDIGKNLVRMVVEGGGWKVVDLGVDTSVEKFVGAVKENPGCAVGLSTLLTTTMGNMGDTVKAIREVAPDTKILVGGAPLTQEFCDTIGADNYSKDPQLALEYLAATVA
jgi:methanogenic corrinoid protein MtbC1